MTVEVLQCTFCGRRKRQGTRFIAGPGVSICDPCLSVATDAVLRGAEPRWPSVDRPSPRRRKWPGNSGCSFCGRRPDQAGAVVRSPDAGICSDCLELCNRIAVACPHWPAAG